jgi:heme oxygenase
VPSLETPTSARAALRAATRDDHGRVDALFARFDLTRPADYRRFLAAQAAAHIPVEAALDRAGAGTVLPDWTSRQRADLLRADLAEAGGGPVAPYVAPNFSGRSALLGGLYVIEGSRLGGAVLRRGLPPDAPARFLGAPTEPGAWRQFIATMDTLIGSPDEVAEAVAAAQAVFRLFERAGRDVWRRADIG